MCIWQNRAAPDRVHEDVPEDEPIVAYKMLHSRLDGLRSPFTVGCHWETGKWKRRRLKPEHSADLPRLAREHTLNAGGYVPYYWTYDRERRWMAARIGFYSYRDLETAVAKAEEYNRSFSPHPGRYVVAKVELAGRVLAYHKKRHAPFGSLEAGFVSQKCRIVGVL